VRENRIEIVAGQKGLDKIVSVLDMNAIQAEERIQAWLSAHTPEETDES
jgi:transketolase